MFYAQCSAAQRLNTQTPTSTRVPMLLRVFMQFRRPFHMAAGKKWLRADFPKEPTYRIYVRVPQLLQIDGGAHIVYRFHVDVIQFVSDARAGQMGVAGGIDSGGLGCGVVDDKNYTSGVK